MPYQLLYPLAYDLSPFHDALVAPCWLAENRGIRGRITTWSGSRAQAVRGELVAESDAICEALGTVGTTDSAEARTRAYSGVDSGAANTAD